MISILLPCYKSNSLLENVFLKSLKNCSTEIELILYNNGESEIGISKAANLMQKNVSVVIIQTDRKNVGLNVALNRCATIARGEYLYLPHTDMYLMPNWDLVLLDECKKYAPHSFLFCSRSIEPIKGHTNFHIIKDYGKEICDFSENKLLDDFRNYNDKSIFFGARMPFFMHIDLWDKMNGVDSKYFSYCTDDDLIQTAYDVGVRVFHMCYGSLVYHLSGKSNVQQSVDKDSKDPYIYFINKWKNKYPNISHPGCYHPRLLPLETRVR